MVSLGVNLRGKQLTVSFEGEFIGISLRMDFEGKFVCEFGPISGDQFWGQNGRSNEEV